jgi:hypothetical protein
MVNPMLGRIETSPPSGATHHAPHFAFRGITHFLALLLVVFCVWLFFSELKRPGIDRLPTDRESAELAAQKRNDARSAAAGAIVRGELWAESAFTFADLLWADSNGDRSSASELKSTIEEARTSLDRAVHYAPRGPVSGCSRQT